MHQFYHTATNTGSTPFSEISPKSVYFIGIGGIGMSALARWFLGHKWSVIGSDIAESEVIQNLKNEGVGVKIGQKKANIPKNIGLFVYNQAIPPKNEELSEAKKRGVPVLSYAEAVGFLTRYYETCAVAGAHGKSTTSSLLSLALLKGGADPTIIVGTLLKELGNKNFHKGKSDTLVLEADEFHSSFLNYAPRYAVITNIDREHLDWYENFGNVKRAFLEFIKNVRSGGYLVLNKDNSNLRSLERKIGAISKKNGLTLVWYSLKDAAVKKVRRVMAHIPGEHMVSNAYAAFLLARKLGVKEKDILSAFRAYHGVWRRMEYKGQIKIKNSKLKIDIYDDYGHHPTEIKATLEGAKKHFRGKNILCAFQPHHGKRLSLLFSDFVKAFDAADALFLFPVYSVAGRDKNTTRVTARTLAEHIVKRKKVKEVVYLEHFDGLGAWIEEIARNGKLPYRDSVLVMMGAGDIYKETKKMIAMPQRKK